MGEIEKPVSTAITPSSTYHFSFRGGLEVVMTTNQSLQYMSVVIGTFVCGAANRNPKKPFDQWLLETPTKVIVGTILQNRTTELDTKETYDNICSIDDHLSEQIIHNYIHGAVTYGLNRPNCPWARVICGATGITNEELIDLVEYRDTDVAEILTSKAIPALKAQISSQGIKRDLSLS